MSTPTAPPPLTCASRPVPANATELDKLQYCKEAVDCSLAITNYNSAITTYNDHITSRNKASEAAWQEKFNLDLAAEEKKLRDERQDTRCVLWTAFSWDGKQNQYCGNDFPGFEADTSVSEAGVSGAIRADCWIGQGKARCRRSTDSINDKLTLFKTSYPSKPVPEPILQQNESKININCCLNFMNIVGEAKGNEQSCLATIDQLSEELKEVNTVQVAESTDIQRLDTDTQNNYSTVSNSQPLVTNLPDWVIYVIIGFCIVLIILLVIIIYNLFF